ncbi:hypothetical protein [Herbidospora cretacea]|uniref:hypothetical protein n=1 Tax=Herbidospora cretacea TaxID=28444 RepID=UPI000774DDF0|nr:hypothetical protein [Herbidospora cretacea]
MWRRIENWFNAQAERITAVFVPDPGGLTLSPYEGYLQVSIAEGLLGQRRHWAKDQYPALHGGVCLSRPGAPALEFTTVQPQDTWKAPGITLNRLITPEIPYNGGSVTVQAGLYRVPADGPLDAAIQVVSSLGDLLVPLRTAADIAGRVSRGLDQILGNLGEQPVLGVNWTMADGSLRAGRIVVVNAPDAPVEFAGDRLTTAPGLDFLVIRLHCRTERSSWLFPELTELIGRSAEAFFQYGDGQVFRDLRTAAVSLAWNSPDLTPVDRKRVARAVMAQVDDVLTLGVVPDVSGFDRIPPADDPGLAALTLSDLLAG